MKKQIIDLNGPNGNAFVLMGYARTLSKKLNLDTNKIISDMMSSDYNHLLEVFKSNFGDYVKFIKQ